MTKYFFNIHCSYANTKYILLKIVVKEFFIIILPICITLFIPLAYTAKEFKHLFDGSFIKNWNASLKSLPFRIAFFVTSGFYLVSIISVFITKDKKTVYDFIANVWVYIYEKKTSKIPNNKPKEKRIVRTGEFILAKENRELLQRNEFL